MSIVAVVLAAGGGTRFHGPDHKLLTPFRGRPLVAWALEAAVGAEGIDEVVLIQGAVRLDDIVPNGVSIVTNPEWSSGQGGSLSRAVEYAESAGHDAVVVGLGDQPLVPSSAWAAVAGAKGEIVTATFGGRRRPPVKLTASIWPDLPDSGDEGARVLFRRWPERVREIACQGEPVDVDTLEDLDAWN